jgi:flavin reductase (DIM6/NTAB) family NADH-FMN oxidoreductase RutF
MSERSAVAEMSAPYGRDMQTITPKILYFGTPVVLLTTQNEDGTANLAPMSSAWALGQTVVLGVGVEGQTALNIRKRSDITISLPGPELWPQVERLAPLTGRHPVPESKRGTFRYVADKFAEVGLTAEPSELVRPPRVAECPLQLEAIAVRVQPDAADAFLIIEATVLRVHAVSRLVIPDTDHVDPSEWSPLIYNFRHYFGLGAELGHSFRSETPREYEAA